MFGRGMHANVWEYLQDRFNVRIIEYYGTTASNIHLGTLLNYADRLITLFSTVNLNFHRGAVGYLPKFIPTVFHPYQLVRILMHNAQPIKTQGGVCDRVDNCQFAISPNI